MVELITLLQSRSEGSKNLEMNVLVGSSNISNRIHVIGFMVHHCISCADSFLLLFAVFCDEEYFGA